jgi:two-component system response regulator HydG
VTPKWDDKTLVRLRKKSGIVTLEEAKQREITKAVKAVKGDKILAAALLGVGKTTLYRKLK